MRLAPHAAEGVPRLLLAIALPALLLVEPPPLLPMLELVPRPDIVPLPNIELGTIRRWRFTAE